MDIRDSHVQLYSQVQHQGGSVIIVGMACNLPGAGNLADFWHLICLEKPARAERELQPLPADSLASVIAAALADRDVARGHHQQTARNARRQAGSTRAAPEPSQPDPSRAATRLLIAITQAGTPPDTELLARTAGADTCVIERYPTCAQALAAVLAALENRQCELGIVAAVNSSGQSQTANASAALVLKRADPQPEDEPGYASICGLDLLFADAAVEEQAWRDLYRRLNHEPDRVTLLDYDMAHTASEFTALHSLFGCCEYPSVLVGSSSALLGSVGAVGTLASVIKSALALYHRALPPTPHQTKAQCLPSGSRLYVRSSLSPWIAALDTPRLAAVASSEQGIRAHLVLQEPPPQQRWAPQLLTPRSCELIVISAPTLDSLVASVEQLRNALDGESVTTLADVAYTLAQRHSTHDQFRLTTVVQTLGELRERLTRAAARLRDDRATSWVDASGIYYGCKPAKGKVAFLFSGVGFPGLSGSYADRLGELALHFPETRWWLDASENTCREDDVPYPLRFQLYPPDNFDPNTLAKIEEELKWSQRAAIGTQVANLATFGMVRSLGVAPGGMCGFSLGEWSALVAAGFIDTQGVEEWRSSYASLAEEVTEPEHRGTWAMAGASAEQVAAIIKPLGDSVNVTLDVSSNQCFIGGDLAGIDRALALLKAAGVWAMPMPSEGPMAAFSKFHTPHARAFATNTRRSLQTLPVRPLQYPIYSSVNARRFPDDPRQIIDLIVDNSSKAVRLRDTVLAMYRDGFRVFVQLGGGGKLLPTLEKILGLEPNVIMSIDVEYLSGLQQFHHAIARLLAMGEPVQPLGLFATRRCRTLDLGLPTLPRQRKLQAGALRTRSSPAAQQLAASLLAARKAHPAPLARTIKHNGPLEPNGKPNGKLNGAAGHAVASAALGGRAAARLERPLPLRDSVATSLAQPAANPATHWPLVGNIQKLVPGEQLHSILTLDLSVHRFLVEHVLILVPDQLKPPSELLPTLPFTFGIEIICEVALTLMPGMRVAAVRDVEQVKFVALKSTSTLDIWIRARRAAESAVIVEFGMQGDTKAALRGAVELTRQRPELPQPAEFEPQDACPHDADWYYGEGPFFHGPLWRAVLELVGMTPQTIHGRLRVTEQRDCFYGEPRPLVLDAVLLDAVAQMMGFREWCERQRFFVPISVKRIVFQDPPQAPALVDARIRWHSLDARRIEGDFCVVDAQGRPVMLVEGWREWWVIWAKPLFQANHLARVALLGNALSPVPEPLNVCRVARSAFLDSDADFVARLYLTATEWQQYQQHLRLSWLLERIAVKDAVRSWYRERRNLLLHPLEVCIDSVSGAQTVVIPDGEPLSVSVAATDEEAVAIVAADCLVGVDLTVLKPREPGFLSMVLDATEMSLLPAGQQLQWTHRAWVAKEAVCKMSGKDRIALDGLRICSVSEDAGVLEIAMGATERTWQVLTVADQATALAIAWQPHSEQPSRPTLHIEPHLAPPGLIRAPREDTEHRDVATACDAVESASPAPALSVETAASVQPPAVLLSASWHTSPSNGQLASVELTGRASTPDVEPPPAALSTLQACVDWLRSRTLAGQRQNDTKWNQWLSTLQSRSPITPPPFEPERCVLRVERLSKHFGPMQVVDNASFNLGAGEILGMVGPNGAGKTTLLTCLMGRVPPDAGAVATFLPSLERASGNGESPPPQVGWVPQQLAVYPFMSARDNLLAFGRYQGIATDELLERVEQALHWANLTERADDALQTYSFGMMRRVNICIGVLSQPQIVLMDEPTLGVDPQSRELIHRMVRDLRARGTAILYTSHYVEEVERLCDRILIIDQGRILCEGTSAELIDRSVGPAREVEIQSVALSVEMRERLQQYGLSCAGNRILVQVQDVSSQLPPLLEQLRRENVPIHDLTIRQPTLASALLAPGRSTMP